MANIEFKDNRIKVKKAIDIKINKFLTEASSLVVSQASKNTRVRTGQTKNSWKSNIDENKKEAKIGSELENSIWEEFGTGEYALKGNGRKNPWTYKDKITGKYYKTKGKRPTRALYRAFKTQESAIVKRAEQILKELD